MKAFFEIIFHCISSVNVSVRVNVLEINKPEKTEDISWHHFWSPCAKPVTFEEGLQRYDSKLMTRTSDSSQTNYLDLVSNL